MATKFPHCDIVGLDLVPPSLGSRTIPPNCRFEVDDANLSLTHWTNTFDFVHCRAVEMGIQDWQAFAYNVAQILKPGGIFVSGTGHTQLLNDKGEPCRVVTGGKPGFRWLQRMFSALYEAINKRKGSEWAAPMWHNIAERNKNFEDVTSQQMYMPVGNWLTGGATTDHQYAAELLRYNFIQLIKSMKPLLLSRGYAEAMIDRWRTETVQELLELEVRSIAVWSWMWCRRRDAPWMPMPHA